MKRCMTRFAFAANCGGCAASGDGIAALAGVAPIWCSKPPRARLPMPQPLRRRASRREMSVVFIVVAENPLRVECDALLK